MLLGKTNRLKQEGTNGSKVAQWIAQFSSIRKGDHTWWEIEWDDGTTGWSADSDPSFGVYIVIVKQ
jgi:hypothetical protein